MAQPCFHYVATYEPEKYPRAPISSLPPSYDSHELPTDEDIQRDLPGAVLASGPNQVVAGLKSTCLGPIEAKGNLNYVVVLDTPVQHAKLWSEWEGQKILTTDFTESGKPKPNYLVWHLSPEERASSFMIELAGLAEDSTVTWSLYTLSATASVGRKGPGWVPEGMESGSQKKRGFVGRIVGLGKA